MLNVVSVQELVGILTTQLVKASKHLWNTLFMFHVSSWSRDGHKLVSASTDNIVSQWDVLTGDCDQRFRFPSPILKLQYHPRDM